MVLLHLPPRFPFSSILLTSSPSIFLRPYSSSFPIPKSFHTLKSALTTSEPIPNTDDAPSSDIETHLPVPAEKLFIPPETDIPVDGSSSRILKGSNIVLSKYATGSQVLQAEFVKSSVRSEDCPSDGLPEFALVGRSNVGKSSLLNSLVRRKKLALTSKKPGHSSLFNSIELFFDLCCVRWWF